MGTESKRPIARRWLHVAVALALPALFCTFASMDGDDPVATVYASGECDAIVGDSDYCSDSNCGPCGDGEGDCDPGQCDVGLECVEEGAVDHCRPVEAVCDEPIGKSDYCDPNVCGPCGEGAGDCDDDSQCAPGLECVEEGTIDRCRAPNGACYTAPSSLDYCEACGPCGRTEGDCEPGQCDVGLACAEEGAVDHCRAVRAVSNLQVQVDGAWRPVCCVDGTPQIASEACWWTEYGRILSDEIAGDELDCAEGGPTTCVCDSSGERMHSSTGDLAGIMSLSGGTMYSDYEMATCVVLNDQGELETDWTGGSCATFRLR